MSNNEKLNLPQKILKIADMAGVLQRTKEGFGYRYVPEEDIQAKVTAGLQKYGVLLTNSIVPGTLQVTPISYEKYDKKIKQIVPVNEVIVQMEVSYNWVDVDDPSQSIETRWVYVGQMEDAAQAFGAAATYGNRYYLMKQLQLATTEADPDAYRSKQQEAEQALGFQETAALQTAIKNVVAKGKELSKTHPRDEVFEVIAKHNGGNKNPASIKDIEICEKIMEDFKKYESTKESKGGNK